MGRFSLRAALGVVAVAAFGFAALRSATDAWLGATFLLTLGLLCAAVLGAVVERGRGVWWLGFAVFGWAYLLAVFVPNVADLPLLPAGDLARRLHLSSGGRHLANSARIGFFLTVLAFARAGATVGCVFTKGLPWRRTPSGASPPLGPG